jgi:glucose/arabinose dehydrogenase
MRFLKKLLIVLLVLAVILGAFLWWISRGVPAQYSVEETTGTDPILAEPDPQTFPTAVIAEPIGWGAGEAPEVAEGLAVSRFAEGLDHPRIIYTMPGGDVLVTLTNAPAGNITGGFFTELVAKFLFAQAGAAVPSPNKLVLLRDADGDGVAEAQHVLRDDLVSPSGIAWRDGKLYIANHNALMRFDYAEGATTLTGAPEKLMDLPAAGNHWMRNIALNPAGDRLYIAVGSASNIAEGGLALEENRAAIHELNLETGGSRQFAAGMRNPNGMAWNPWTGELWATVNERDMLGSDLVPDYMSNVPLGVHYGWPWVYYNEIEDERVVASMPQHLTNYTRTPEYALGAHVAALGMVFTQEGARMGPGFGQGAFIARHGSWNRKPAAGYDVVFVEFDNLGNPQGKPKPVLASFLAGEGQTHGRPTWLAWDRTGALLVSDDTAGIIWRVNAPGAAANGAIQRNSGRSLPPQRELRGDPRRAFENPPADIVPGAI